MSTPVRLTDRQIEQLLQARAATPDARLLDDILGATAALPHRTERVGPYPQSRRMLVLLAAALLLAALAGALALGMRLVEPRPSPLEPMFNVQYIPCSPSTGTADRTAECVRFEGEDGTGLQLFPAGDPECAAIGIEADCFAFKAWFGTVRGEAGLTNGDLALTALICSTGRKESASPELPELSAFAEMLRDLCDRPGVSSVLLLEQRAGGELLYVHRCEGEGIFCLAELTRWRFGRVTKSQLPWPPGRREDVDLSTRYGWPGFRNILTFAPLAGWDADATTSSLRRMGDLDRRVEIIFVGTSTPSYTPQEGETAASIGPYPAWYRDEHPASLDGARRQRWTVNIQVDWVVIQLLTGPRAAPEHIAEAMQLLDSIRAPDDA